MGIRGGESATSLRLHGDLATMRGDRAGILSILLLRSSRFDTLESLAVHGKTGSPRECE